MGRTILPSGEELSVTPEEILRYLNPDGLRQLFRQERLRWNLKPNRDIDYQDNQLLFKYTGELHNNRFYQKMETRTFPDNGAFPGYAGIFIDSGVYGIIHELEKWDKAMTDESKQAIINRTMLGAMATVPNKEGYGLDEHGNMTTKTANRMAAIMFDPYDGRAYLYSNDNPNYVNNETRTPQLPGRTLARVCDIPTRMTQLMNDLDFIADPDYRHTDNNFTNSNRFVLDNLDDRTFVYPEISKDSSGDYIENYRVGLNGEPDYGQSDGMTIPNTQPDLGLHPELGDFGDRSGDAISSLGVNQKFSGVSHRPGYLPGIFRSYEELCRVDLVDQKMTPRNHNTPGGKRSTNYYILDGKWGSNWFDRIQYNDSYLAQSLNPYNMEIAVEETEPTPYSKINQTNDIPFAMGELYQWRYNRVDLLYYSKDITISIVESGQEYRVGDILRWTFGDDVFLYIVDSVGPNGQIQKGHYHSEKGDRIFEQDPSTHGVGLPFSNMSGVGHGAKLSLYAKATIESHATQIKNNLMALVDVTPTVRSDNSTDWSDTSVPDTKGGRVNVRSTAAAPAYSGINSGRGGPSPSASTNTPMFHEHGGNATAGVHLHLFRYVIDTQNPSWVIRDGIQVFLGKWVDMGPLGVERPCDIKALLFSNPDTNNFNNYYKFMLDSMLDTITRNPDAVATNNTNALAQAYIHRSNTDPRADQRFTITRFDPDTTSLKEEDVTDKVLYINAATGCCFYFNPTYKNDPTYGYGMRPPGWYGISGSISK